MLTTAAALAAAAAMPPRKVRLEVGTTGTRSLRETLEGAVGQLWNRVSTAQKSVKAVPRVETEPGATKRPLGERSTRWVAGVGAISEADPDGPGTVVTGFAE
ncbi:hypothetical protein GCM10009529_17400 [Micropruina glycogenica]